MLQCCALLFNVVVKNATAATDFRFLELMIVVTAAFFSINLIEIEISARGEDL